MALKGATKPMTENSPETKTVIQDHSEEGSDLPWKEEEGAEPMYSAAEEEHPPVAAAQPSKAVAAPSGGFLANVGGADDGFGALDDQIGFGSFPMVKLDKNTFVIENAEYSELLAVMFQARSKWIYKVDDENFVYSYDNVNDLSGKPLSAKIREWKAQGLGDHSSSMYMEVAAKIVSEGKHKGKLVLLNVAPASVKRLGGYRAELKFKNRTLSQVVTRIYPGSLIKLNAKISFHPWNFEFSRDVADEDLQ